MFSWNESNTFEIYDTNARIRKIHENVAQISMVENEGGAVHAQVLAVL
jgi:hypothetical protein